MRHVNIILSTALRTTVFFVPLIPLIKASLKTALISVVFLMLLSPVVSAKEATSMAIDPVMEKIVIEISEELRCLVCQNQTIADSNADLAVDLKTQVREMVKAGQTQEEIVEYMVERYGDFIRYRPPMKPTTVLLWAGPFLLLLIGMTVLFINLRKRSALLKDGDLSSDENERLKALLESEPVQKESKS
ncbi:MAG: cytochrome c-type biogenesis protein CcmH [Ectothiorhodospiraceae bacterium]|nr:cytochrome c-type biogenesis protein CcmH [Ectothiorhodospiraceae bacterium]